MEWDGGACDRRGRAAQARPPAQLTRAATLRGDLVRFPVTTAAVAQQPLELWKFPMGMALLLLLLLLLRPLRPLLLLLLAPRGLFIEPLPGSSKSSMRWQAT